MFVRWVNSGKEIGKKDLVGIKALRFDKTISQALSKYEIAK
jgi:hypothetical protein